MLQNTLDFYTGLLEDAGFMIVDDEIRRLVIRKGAKHYMPIKAGGKTLVMGTKANLDKDDGTTIVFHPLREDALRGESYTLTELRKQMNATIRLRVGSTLYALGKAIVENRDKKVNKNLTKLLNMNPTFNLKSYKELDRLLNNANTSTPARHIIGIYLNATDCKFEGKSVKRLARVSSSMRDALEKGEKEIWGLPIPLKHQEAIGKLFDTILPNVNGDEYSYGSNNKTAPYFDCLVNAFMNISYQLDSIDKVLSDKNALAPVPKYTWVEKLGELAKLAMPIPPLEGNLGNDVVGDTAFNTPNPTTKLQETAPAATTTSVPASTTTTTTATPAVNQSSAFGARPMDATPPSGMGMGMNQGMGMGNQPPLPGQVGMGQTPQASNTSSLFGQPNNAGMGMNNAMMQNNQNVPPMGGWGQPARPNTMF